MSEKRVSEGETESRHECDDQDVLASASPTRKEGLVKTIGTSRREEV